jgi:hypothetical protein
VGEAMAHLIRIGGTYDFTDGRFVIKNETHHRTFVHYDRRWNLRH